MVDGFDPAVIRDRDDPADQWRDVKVRGNVRFALPLAPDAPPALVPPPAPEEVLLTRAIAAAEMLHRQGIVVTPDELFVEDKGIPLQLWRELAETEQFQHALEVRGIPPASLTGLTPRMLSALELFFEMEGKSFDQRLRAAGINRRIWTSWMRIPQFAKYVEGHGELALKDAVPAMLEQVAEKGRRGEKWAVELGLEITGRHDRRQQQTSIQDVLMTVFMALDDAGVPADMLSRIGDSIRRRMGAPEGAPVIQLPAGGDRSAS